LFLSHVYRKGLVMLLSYPGFFGYRKEMVSCKNLTGNPFTFTRFHNPSSMSCKRIAFILSHEKNKWEQEEFYATIDRTLGAINPGQFPDIDIFVTDNRTRKFQEEGLWVIRHDSNSYSAIVTFGNMPSIAFYEAQKEWPLSVKQVFAAVDNPKETGLIRMNGAPKENIVGVQRIIPSCKEQISLLKNLTQGATEVLMPRDGSRFEQTNAQSILDKHLQENGYRVTSIPLLSKTNVEEVITPYLKSHQILCINNESPVLVHTQKLLRLAQQENLFTFSTNTTTVRLGAHIGWGNSGQTYGPYIAYLLTEILKDPSNCDRLQIIKLVESNEVRFNPESLYQNNNLSAESKALLETRSIRATDEEKYVAKFI